MQSLSIPEATERITPAPGNERGNAMKMVAQMDGKVYPILVHSQVVHDWMVVDLPDSPALVSEADGYKRRLSTGMEDKNGRVILVGDTLKDGDGVLWKVAWDGYKWRLMTRIGTEWERCPLTPELAATHGRRLLSGSLGGLLRW